MEHGMKHSRLAIVEGRCTLSRGIRGLIRGLQRRHSVPRNVGHAIPMQGDGLSRSETWMPSWAWVLVSVSLAVLTMCNRN